MSVNITYFVHGTTADNENGLASGWNDVELSPTGIAQAKKLGELVADKSFDIVFCSDLKRAFDSAQLAFGNKFRIIQDQRLREINYGDYNGQPNIFKNQMVDYINKQFPNGESYKDVEKRMNDFLDFLRNDYAGKNVAIVSHQGPQLALEVLLNKKTWEQAINQDWRNKKAWQPGWEYLLAA